MKFFIDTADIAEIRDLAATGLVDGVTTNPSLIAKSGRKFLDVVAEICAVITDHIMPGMSGSQFVRELRKIQPDLPVMVVSGMEEAEPEYEGMNVVFLLKPLSPDLMLSNLRDLLQQDQQGAA